MRRSRKWISVLLSFVMVLTMVPFWAIDFAPKANAYSNYSKNYSTEYYYASGTKFIYQLILYYSSSSNGAASDWLSSNGWTDWSGNFNAGDGHSSKYVHSGYKTTTDPTQAIKGILVADGHPSTVSYGGATYYAVGGGGCTQTPTGGDGCVDLNKGNGGDDLYLMATPDRAAGPALTAITKSQSGNSGTAQNNLTNNGYRIVTDQSGNYQDTNAGAGGDFNYCGQKSSCTTVNSDRLREAYKYANDCYANGGSAYSGLSSALNTASNILSDLNDGYTTRNQATIDSATLALYDAMPSMSLNTEYTVNINTANMRRYFRFTPSEAGKYVFFSYATSGDSRGYLINRDSTYGIGSTNTSNDDGPAKAKNLLGMGNTQYFFVTGDLTANTTYYFYADFYSTNTGSFPMKVCKAVDVTFNATGGSTTFTQTLPAGHNGMKMNQSGLTRTNHSLIAWSTNGSGAEAKTYLASETVAVPTSAKTYYALWNPSSAPTLTVNSDYTATIDQGAEIEFYQFTPSTTRKYHFYGLSSDDTYALLYNASTYASAGTYDKTSDDQGSSDFGQSTNQFRFTETLTAGTTYLYGVKYYNSTNTGSIPFRFEEIYAVSYNANGGSGAPSAQDKFYNKALTLSTTEPTRTGYTFKGWSTSSTATSATYAAGGSYTANADATLYAVWEANKYTVTLNGNGATTAGTASVTATYDKAMPSATMPLRTGFTFEGYYDTSATTGGTQYYTAAGASARTWNKTDAATLYARWTEHTYNIAFDGNGATGGSTAGISGVKYTESKTLTSNGFTKTGYSFNGWNTAANGSGAGYANSASVSKLSATNGATVTLYAQWSINQYTLTVNPNGGSFNGSTGNSTFTQDYNSTKTVADPADRTGFDFTGWTLSGEGAWNASNKSFTYGAGAGTLTAGWNEHEYDIVFDGNGATGGSTVGIDDVKYTASATLTENGFEKTGYSFNGWNTAANGSGDNYADKASVSKLTAEDGATVTLYAQWSINQYTLTVDPNGGSFNNSTASSTFTQDYDSTKAIADASRTGYTFGGWTLTGAGAWNASDKTFTYGAGAGTLTANWTATPYTVTYDANGGSVDEASLDYDIESSATLATPVREGYTFNGWQPSADAGSWSAAATYAAGAGVGGMYGDVTLVAQWSVNQYTLTVDPDGGVFAGSESVSTFTQDYASTKEIADASRTGCEFTGWTLSGAGAWNADTKTFTYGAGAATLTAGWNANVYTVAFDGNGATGGATASIEKTYGTDKALTANGFTRTGYTFGGWATSADGAAAYTDGATLNADLTTENGVTVTLFAVWEPIEYTLTLSLDGGDYDGDTEIAGYYQGSVEIKDPTKLGYRFLGWTADKGTIADGVYTFTDSDAVLTASWEAIDYTLIVKPDGGEYAGETTVIGNINTSVTLGTPVKKGYSFDGWTLTVGSENSKLEGSVFTFWAEDAEVTAQYSAIDYTLTVDAAGGSFTGEIENPYHIGDTVAIPDPTKTGYGFDGWTVSAGTLADGVYTFTDSDAALTANWTATDYTLTVDPDGGEYDGDTAVIGNINGTVTLGTPVRKGYTFDGWTLTVGSENSKLEGNVFTFWAEDATVTAQYTAIDYTLTVDAAGGEYTGTVANPYHIGDQVTIPDPTKTGFDFDGWTVSAGTLADGVYTFTDSDASLTANWTARPYKIAFDANGGTGDMEALDAVYGTPLTLTGCGFAKLGYEFKGWALSTDGEKVYGDGVEVVSLTAEKNAVVTLYAVWEAIDYTLTVDANGGTAIGETSVTGNIGGEYALGVETRDGFELTGWQITAGSGSVVKNGDDYIFRFTASDATVQAQWLAIPYTLTLDANGGTAEVETLGGFVNDTVTLPTPVRKGYRFLGWTADKGTVSADFTTYTFAASSATVTAQWEKIPYTLTIDVNGGNTTDPATVTKYLDETYTLAEPSREGYDFTGWLLTAGRGSLDSENAVFTFDDSNATVQAQWDAIPYTLTVDAADGVYHGDATVTGIIGQTVVLGTVEREGYRFLGWTADKGTVSADGSEYTFVASDATVTASWEAIDYTLSVVVDDAIGSFSGETSVVGHIGDTVELSVPVSVSHDFTGWTADKGSVSGNAYTFAASDATVTATWEIKTFTVTFVSDLTGESEEETVAYSDDASAPTFAQLVNKNNRTHYVFDGWNQSFDDVTGDLTVTAVYTTAAHDWTLVERVAPVCEGEGSERYTCDCGAEKTETLPDIGHNWSDSWIDDGNLETHTRFCLNDGNHTQTAAHQWDDGVVAIAPTCCYTGVMIYTCTVCGAQGAKPIDALGHDWGEWTPGPGDEADCEHGGSEYRVCRRCDAEDTREVIQLCHDLPNAVLGEGYCSHCGQFVCSSCDQFHVLEQTPGIGTLYKIIHFFIHTFHQIKFRT